MCGRYRIKDPNAFQEYVKREYGIEFPPMTPRFNIAPSQELPVLAAASSEGALMVAPKRWGLVPFWDKCEKPRLAPINARSEDAFAKPMFRQAIQRRRAAIPCDGFFEWRRLAGDVKLPMDIHLRGDHPFFFAGIYETATAVRPDTFLLFTTRPNALMADIHDRMPVILTAEQVRDWVKPGEMTSERFSAFMQPYPSDEMEARPISRLINNPRNDRAECLAGPDE